jgi:hypothetical protein
MPGGMAHLTQPGNRRQARCLRTAPLGNGFHRRRPQMSHGGPVSPDNVEKTAVSPGGHFGSPTVTAEAE